MLILYVQVNNCSVKSGHITVLLGWTSNKLMVKDTTQCLRWVSNSLPLEPQNVRSLEVFEYFGYIWYFNTMFNEGNPWVSILIFFSRIWNRTRVNQAGKNWVNPAYINCMRLYAGEEPFCLCGIRSQTLIMISLNTHMVLSQLSLFNTMYNWQTLKSQIDLRFHAGRSVISLFYDAPCSDSIL